MTRIRVLSDLHQEFWPFDARSAHVPCDAVVLAGDTHVGLKGLRWATEAFSQTPVVYVAGNHEYYRQAIPKLTTKLQGESKATHVHFLERRAVDLNGVRFLGCTLWAGLSLHGPPWRTYGELVEKLNDFRLIRVSPRYRRLVPEDLIKWHHASVSWLDRELRDDTLPTVVVTHHAPSPRSLPLRDEPDPLDCAWASDLEEMIRKYEPALWIHGHIHRATSYQIGRTRIVCNPRGYPDQAVSGFDPRLVVEVG